MVFYLIEAQFYIIGVDNNAVCGVRDPQVVCPDEDLLADVAEFAMEF